MFLFSPLEQFNITYLVPISFLNLDFSLTIIFFIYSFILIFILVFYYSFFEQKINIQIIPKNFYYNLEMFCIFAFNLLKNLLPNKGIKFFPLIFIPFFFITLSNIFGLIPYSYTLTSQLFITSVLALASIFGVIFNGFKTYKLSFLSIFLPPNTSILLSFLIIPIEIISYLFRPLSLAVRLFANMMAGHALLKVIVSFAWKLLILGLLIHSVSIALLLILFLLEFAVAGIQAYVFTMLIILYINELFAMH